MIYLIFIWFTLWCATRVVKSEPAMMMIIVIGWVMAMAEVFGVPHLRG